MTQAQINAAFARSELTPAQAADETMKRREPTLMSMAVWGVVFPALVLLLLAYALWWAHSGER